MTGPSCRIAYPSRRFSGKIAAGGMVMGFSELVSILHEAVWGPGTQFLMVSTGLFLTLRLRFLPWRRLGHALRGVFSPSARNGQGRGISPLAALMTSLAGTLGTGNIAGVSTALAAGGPGALIWMEISALLGISISFAECVLSARYRLRSKNGTPYGGPMYVMRSAIRPRWLGRSMAGLFAVCTVLASFGVGGMTQSGAIADAAALAVDASRPTIAAAVCLLSLPVIRGGIRRISALASAAVPAMSVLYLIGGLAVILGHLPALPAAAAEMFRLAFSPQAAAGGAAGACVSWLTAARFGLARGCFSHEAGMGSAAIAAAAADGSSPVEQGYISMTAPFFDTVVMCTMTGLAVCVSGVLGSMDATGTPITGAQLTILAFRSVLGDAGALLICICLILFGFSTIPSWAYLGEQALRFLTCGKGIALYRILFAGAVFFGGLRDTEPVWKLADICNALMCFPNLVCVLLLSDAVARELRQHQTHEAPPFCP